MRAHSQFGDSVPDHIVERLKTLLVQHGGDPDIEFEGKLGRLCLRCAALLR